MGTRSFIGRLNEDGSVDAIYCHFDGYAYGVGFDLCADFDDPAKVDRLIEQGGRSSLQEGKEYGGGHHHFANLEAYRADLGDCDTEYLYFYDKRNPDDQRWQVCTGWPDPSGFQPVAPLAAKELRHAIEYMKSRPERNEDTLKEIKAYEKAEADCLATAAKIRAAGQRSYEKEQGEVFTAVSDLQEQIKAKFSRAFCKDVFEGDQPLVGFTLGEDRKLELDPERSLKQGLDRRDRTSVLGSGPNGFGFHALPQRLGDAEILKEAQGHEADLKEYAVLQLFKDRTSHGENAWGSGEVCLNEPEQAAVKKMCRGAVDHDNAIELCDQCCAVYQEHCVAWAALTKDEKAHAYIESEKERAQRLEFEEKDFFNELHGRPDTYAAIKKLNDTLVDGKDLCVFYREFEAAHSQDELKEMSHKYDSAFDAALDDGKEHHVSSWLEEHKAEKPLKYYITAKDLKEIFKAAVCEAHKSDAKGAG